MMKIIIFALVALLATFLHSAVGVLDCGSGGAQDLSRTSMCNCYSGYAPSNVASADCDSHPICPFIEQSDETVGDYGAERPVTSFSSDRLYIYQRLPVVENRLGTTIRLAHPVGTATAGKQGSSTCGYPGVLWNKTVNADDCADEFRGFIPWNKHEMCGFVLDTTNTNNNTLVYKATLVTQYNETYVGYNGKQELRKMMNAYSVSVSFQKQITVPSENIQIVMHSPAMTLKMVGSVTFDTYAGAMSLTLRSSSSWPYKVDANALAAAYFHSSKSGTPPTGVTATITPGTPLSCGSTVDSVCQQEWNVVINRGSAENCDISGEYGFNSTFTCRDGAPCVGAPSANFAFKMLPVDFCAENDVDASAKSVFEMRPYADEARKSPSDKFIVGQYIYFVVTVEDPVSTLKGITFSNINLITNGLPDTVYSTAGASSANGINLKLHEVNTIVSPGQKAELSFSFQLMRTALPNALGSIVSGNSAKVAVEATVNLVYHGSDKKREIEVAMELAQGSATKEITVSAEEGLAHVSSSPLYTIPLLSIFFFLSFVMLF